MHKKYLLFSQYLFPLRSFSTITSRVQSKKILLPNNLNLQKNIQNFLENNNSSLDKKKINLLNTFLTKNTIIFESHQDKIAEYICRGKIKSPCDLDKTLNYIKENYIIKGSSVDWNQVENHCGISQEMNEEDLEKELENYFESNQNELRTCSQNELAVHLRFLREKLSQAPAKQIFEKFNQKVKQLRSENNEIQSKTSSKTHCIWDNLTKLQARELLFSINSSQSLEKHKQEAKGEIFFRFPPEPNGFLHLGHAKAMRINFGSAERLGGKCFLRYDDTNPDKEEHGFKVSIENNVNWLGHRIEKITNASDYFPQILQFAEQLIEKNLAFVSEDCAEEMQNQRKEKRASVYRNRNKEENLKEGKHPPQKYCLRAKIDYVHPNPTMRDPVICRVKKQNGKYGVFPCYDFTHCISDSLENIVFSLCTLEFEIRRDLYYWFLDALDLYKPKVYEYSRLNIAGNVLSKRKLKVLIEAGELDGWDDPRLLTLDGMKRRGYTPIAINNFCDLINASRNGNETQVPIHMLEHCLRKDLDKNANRIMAVIDPIQVEIENQEKTETISIANHPKNKNKGFREIKLTNKIFLDKKDIENLENDCIFGLKYVGVFKCIEINKENELKIKATQIFQKIPEKIQYFHWISEVDSIDCEIRLFSQLFVIDEINKLDSELDVLKKYLSPKSKEIVKNVKFPKNILNHQEKNWQFERIGYFCIDEKDSDLERNNIILNMSVSLK